jgi:hypothetical protein
MDSGCRSNSFLNDEDSAVYSMATTVTTASSSSHLMVPGAHKQQQKSLSSSSIGSSSSSGDETNEKRENSKKKVESGDFGCNTISEHLEFTCSRSSPVKPINAEDEAMPGKMKKRVVEHDESDNDDDDDANDCSSECDTSDDASELPDENLSTATSAADLYELDDDNDNDDDDDNDDLNDLDLDFELAAAAEADELKVSRLEPLIKYNQVLEDDGSVLRKKLDSGIYKSVNETASLFIEPHDVLKRMEMNEFDEYNLFPHGHNSVDEDGVAACSFEDNLDSLVDDAAARLVISKF